VAVNPVTVRQTTIRASHAPIVVQSTTDLINRVAVNLSLLSLGFEMTPNLMKFAASVAIIFLAVTASAQLTVDATGPIRERRRAPGGARGGGIGRKLPIRVALKTNGSPQDENGKTLVTFTVTNSGKDDFEIPISPHPRDFEPSSAAVSYKVRCMALLITVGKPPGTIVPGALLYGNRRLPGTIVALKSGASIHVIARVALPPPNSTNSVVVASVILNNETLEIVKGHDFSEMQEIGSARSSEYTAQSLIEPAD
jgi:hypothetical protein